MIVGLTGASGFVGRHILRHAVQRGHEVIAFSRRPEQSVPGVRETRLFSLDAPPDLRGCAAVIHLAGEPILGMWTRTKRDRILKSRVEGTRRLVEGIAALSERPEVLVSASAIGYYQPGADQELTELAPADDGFLAGAVRAWESEAIKAQTERVVLLRIAVVLGKEGGALRLMAPVFRLGLGGTLGDGQQWMSWIHVEDLARLALFAMEDADVCGPVNASAPWPVRQRDFSQALAAVLHRPAFFRVPAFLLRALLGGLAGELLESKRVVPAAAISAGFGFKFSEVEPALRDLFA
jgi:uncharacterized protein (TIGR01777 family)